MKISKFKLLTALIVLLAATALLSAGALADEFYVEDDGTLTSYDGPGGNVVIPSVVMKTGYLSDGTEYTYPVTVTSIVYAFYECSSLTSVTIPNSVTSIGPGAFGICSNLTSVTIPNSVTSIGFYAFGSCSSLTNVTLPNSLTILDDYAFAYCSSFTNIKIPGSVTSIGEHAFRECSNLTSIALPNSVTNIGNDAFSGCSSLTSVTIPDGVTSIGEWAFCGCSSLESVVIPDSVISIGELAFCGCSSLTSIVIPDSVTSIGVSAFGDCSSLTSVTIPDGVTSIGDGAFCGCISLESVVIPDSVISIGERAFCDCSSLTNLEIPWSVAEIKSDTFYNCSSLENVVIPDSVTKIGDYAFVYCSSLTNVQIPNSVKSIGEFAFAYCSSLTSVEIPNSVTNISYYSFACCSSLTNVTIPEGVTSIGEQAFRGCTSLTSIEFPIGLKKIETYAFYECSGLEKTVFWDKTTAFGERAFFKSNAFVVYCYRNSTAEEMAQDRFAEIVYLDKETSIELINPVMDSSIESFTYACGSFLFDSEDCTELELHYTVCKDDEENILPYCDFSITLPDGFSFEEYKVVQSKHDFRGYYNEDGVAEGKITIYPLYSSVCPDELTFEISGGANHKESVSVTRAENEGVVLCQNTAFVSLASPSDPIEMETSKDYVGMFINTAVDSFNDRINELSCTLTQAIYNEEFMRQSLKNLGFTKIEFIGNDDAYDVANTFAVKKIVQGGMVEDLLMVVIRGTVGVEWFGNLVIVDQDAPGEHANFRTAANNTLKRLNAYCSTVGTSKQHTQALICGHSRGGAVTDLLAHDLNVSAGSPVRKLRAYTYAAPNSTQNPSRDSNIFNYLFYGDLVGYVPGCYSKHGINFVVGSQCEKTEDVPAAVQQAFRMYSAGRAYSLPKSSLLINTVIAAGASGNKLASQKWLYDMIVGQNEAASEVKAASRSFDILQGHGAEGYLAWVYQNGRNGFVSYEYALDKMDDHVIHVYASAVKLSYKTASAFLNSDIRYRYLLQLMKLRSNNGGAQAISVSCPVDVEVIDANGTVLASFASHQLVSADQERLFAFSEGETDYILLPQNEGMTVRITGNAEGTMKLGLVCTGADDGDFILDKSEVTQSASFTDVPVSAGQTYQLTFAPSGAGVQWALLDPEGKEYQRDPFSNPMYLPDALTAISDEAYLGCTDLTGTIVCPDGMVSIGAKAFSGAGISGIVIPASVESIAADAFENTSATIYCAKDSAAHRYAAERGIPVVIISGR